MYELGDESLMTDYFLDDALGPARQLTDSNGNLTLSKTYDPYGTVAQSAGAGQSSYGYTSEYQDGYNQLVYLRARHYAPSMGRFLSRDTWAGDVNRPGSLNRWNYVEGNPVNFVDPTGMFTSLYADFVSDDPKGFHEIDKTLIDSALVYISQAYERGYQDFVYRLILSECIDENYIIAMSNPNPSGFSLFLRIHNGKIKFTKWNTHPGEWAIVRARNDIYIYRRGVLSNWDAYEWMGGNIGKGTANPGDKYVRFLAGESIESFDESNWAMVTEKYMRFITHEMGHAFDNAVKDGKGEGQVPRKSVENMQNKGNLPKPQSPSLLGGFCGTGGSLGDGWQWRLESQKDFPGEIFADMFVGWVNDCEMSFQRSNFMNNYMPLWVFYAYHHLPIKPVR